MNREFLFLTIIHRNVKCLTKTKAKLNDTHMKILYMLYTFCIPRRIVAFWQKDNVAYTYLQLSAAILTMRQIVRESVIIPTGSD